MNKKYRLFGKIPVVDILIVAVLLAVLAVGVRFLTREEVQNQTGAALSVHLIADGQVEAAEFTADEKTRFCGVPLRELKLRRGVLVVGISHAGAIVIPDGNSSFGQGDTLVVVSGRDKVLLALNDIFE